MKAKFVFENINILKPKTEKDVNDELMGIDNDDMFPPYYWMQVAQELKETLHKNNGVSDVKLSGYKYDDTSRDVSFMIHIGDDTWELSFNYDWDYDGSEGKPVTQATIAYTTDGYGGFDDNTDGLGRYAIWDDPKTTADDYRDVFIEMLDEWKDENEYDN